MNRYRAEGVEAFPSRRRTVDEMIWLSPSSEDRLNSLLHPAASDKASLTSTPNHEGQYCKPVHISMDVTGVRPFGIEARFRDGSEDGEAGPDTATWSIMRVIPAIAIDFLNEI
jgi:hypothetical protein